MQERINTTDNAAWGGIVLSILGNIGWQNPTHTVIMAIIGTVVSFFTSALLRKISRHFKKR